jgi:hypothetical protein
MVDSAPAPAKIEVDEDTMQIPGDDAILRPAKPMSTSDSATIDEVSESQATNAKQLRGPVVKIDYPLANAGQSSNTNTTLTVKPSESALAPR